MTREREGLYTRQKYLYVYAGTKWGRGVGGGCGVIAGFYGNVKGHPPYNIRDIVSEYEVYNLLLASPL